MSSIALHLPDQISPLHHDALFVQHQHQPSLGSSQEPLRPTSPMSPTQQASKEVDPAEAPDGRNPHRVCWEAHDPDNPQTWSTLYKSWLTFQIGMLSMAASLGTAIMSPALDTVADEFGVSHELIILNTSLYLLGMAFGPILWAPMSEVWGRRISLLPQMLCLAAFSVGAGAGRNVATIFVCRFFSGVFGSSPVSNVSAALGDLWSAQARGTATAVYALAVVGGPTIGPVVGSAITTTIGWRWTGYILAVWVATFTILSVFLYPETYHPVLLKRRAQRLRKETGNARWYHPHEDVKIDPRTIIVKQFARPIRMLVTEPMVAALALYAAFVYALQFVSLEVFPYVYGELFGWDPITASLPFLALFIGEFGAAAVCLTNQPYVIRAIKANDGKPVPESRIPPMILGGIVFVVGLFWFGWTAAPNLPWESSVAAALLLGSGFDIIFQQCVNILVDIYKQHAASAVSAQTFLRSILAAGLPLAARPMVTTLGVGPAMSLPGGFATLAVPVPILLMKYGVALRKRSQYAPYEEPASLQQKE